MNTIHESAAETAKKIRKELKVTFPGIKFSVTSSTYSMGCSVSVHWTDGPMSNQVDDVLIRFKSASFDGMQDMKVTTGYMFEGQHFNGADYVSGSRSFSPEYRKQIEAKAFEMFEDYNINSWEAGRQMKEAEAALLGLNPLETADPVDVVAEVIEPVAVVEQPSNVVNFVAKRVQKWEDTLTPEQRLKMYVISQLFDKGQAAEMIASGKTVDEIFSIIAIEAYKEVAK